MRITLDYIDYKKELKIKSFLGNKNLYVDFLLENKWEPSQKRVVVDSDVSKEWLEASTRYLLKEITPHDRITLFNYSTNEYAVINDFMQGGDDYKKEFTVRQAKDTPSKQLVMNALYAFKDEPDVKKWYKQWIKAGTPKENETVLKEFKEWLKAQPNGIPYDKIQENYNEIFFGKALAYLPQLRVLDIHTIAQLRKQYLDITLPQWRRVLTEYVKDVERIFKESPPLPEPLTVYRGLRQRPKPSRKGLVSTSLSKKIANTFINRTKKCCLQTIEVPKGAHVLPLFAISMFNVVEIEMLLQSYPSQTRKNKK